MPLAAPGSRRNAPRVAARLLLRCVPAHEGDDPLAVKLQTATAKVRCRGSSRRRIDAQQQDLGVPFVWSFSDACMATPSTRANGRRSKSPNGRNRERWGDYGAAGAAMVWSGRRRWWGRRQPRAHRGWWGLQAGDAIAVLEPAGSAHNPSVLVRFLS